MASAFTDLRVWQNAMKLVVRIYRRTRTFPKEELYSLTSQIRRASVSVPSNIAEGKGYKTDKEFIHFLYRARGSCLEVQTQIIVARELEYLDKDEAKELLEHASQIGRELNALIAALDKSSTERSKRASAGR